MFNSDDDDFFEEKINIRFVDEDDTYAPLMYEDLPSEYQNILDSFASELLDPYRGKVGIVGTSNAGKSFLINQLVGNIDRYLDKVGRDKMNFIYLDDDDLDTIMMLPNRYQDYITALMNTLDCNERDIVFVTEEPTIAAKITNFSKKAGIILEASHSTVEGIAQMEHSGATKMWGSWPFIDVNDILLKKKDLVNMLYLSLNEKIQETFKVHMSKKNILMFVNYALKEIPELLGLEGDVKNKVLAPIGVWAVIIRRMGGVIGLSESPELRWKNQLVLSRVIENVLRDNIDMLEDFISEEQTELVIPSPDGLSALRIPIPKSFAERMKPMSGTKDTDENVQAEIKTLKFNDLDKFSEKLHEEIIGQDSALETIVESMLVPAAGLNDDTKPLKSFLFLGPTGTGKTKAALTIAENLGTEPLHLIRIDMSEYSHPHEAAKLLGAPPGYAGFESGGVLTNAVKAHPNSLILLDEVEKAHPKIWDSFLQIFDAGRMTDGSGTVVDFRQTVIVMTSNLGAAELKKKSSGFSTLSEKEAYDKRQKNSQSIIMKAVESEFRAEMINRIDEIVIFNELSLEVSREIVRKEISILNDRMKKQGYELEEVGTDIVDEVLSKSNVAKYGAREIQRVILRNLSNPIAKSIVVSKNDKDKNTIEIVLDDEKKISVKQK